MNENNYAKNALALRRLFEKDYIRKLKYPVQVPQPDAPRWPPRLIILMKVSPRSQIMPPWPKNGKFSIPVIKKIYPRGF